MPDLADLFPGYASKWINTSSGRIFARVGGKGPPLLLLHGFSETHVMWHRVAPQLADSFTLIIADLPGYGWSDMPESDSNHTPYTKRAMAQTMIGAMEALGPVHFALAGHDRGGRVAYRVGCAGRFRSFPDRGKSRCDREGFAGVFWGGVVEIRRSPKASRHTRESGYPVRRSLSIPSPALWNTGSSAFADDEGGVWARARPITAAP
jgi:hypothetical protein